MKLAADGTERSFDLVGGRPLWPALHGSFPSYPPISADTTCDAAVIGGGVTGALIASVLAESGFDVLVIERHKVAGGSTAANTALLLYETDLPLHRLADRIGERNAAQVYRLGRDAVVRFADVVRGLDETCGFAGRPSLYLASREEDVPPLRREHELRRRHGFAVELLERADIESRYAFSSPAALLSRDAAELDPVCFTHRLLAHAARRGARVHERCATRCSGARGRRQRCFGWTGDDGSEWKPTSGSLEPRPPALTLARSFTCRRVRLRVPVSRHAAS